MKFDTITPMPPIQLRMTHSKDKLRRWRKELTGITPSDDPTRSAETSSFIRDNEIAFLVYMSPSTWHSSEEDAALLAHEAVHVAQKYLGFLGEDKPADEEMAYIVQTVSGYLIGQHFEWKRKQLQEED